MLCALCFGNVLCVLCFENVLCALCFDGCEQNNVITPKCNSTVLGVND